MPDMHEEAGEEGLGRLAFAVSHGNCYPGYGLPLDSGCRNMLIEFYLTISVVLYLRYYKIYLQVLCISVQNKNKNKNNWKNRKMRTEQEAEAKRREPSRASPQSQTNGDGGLAVLARLGCHRGGDGGGGCNPVTLVFLSRQVAPPALLEDPPRCR